EVHRQGAEQGAGDGAHAWRADPAHLLVRRGLQAVLVAVVELRVPLGDPAARLPLLHHFDEAAVAGGEVLGSEVQRAGVAALAGHAPAAAAALVDLFNLQPGGVQGLRGGEARQAGTDDGDGCAHGLPRLPLLQATLSTNSVQTLVLYSYVRFQSRTC